LSLALAFCAFLEHSSFAGSRSLTDRTRASEACNTGSIPVESTIQEIASLKQPPRLARRSKRIVFWAQKRIGGFAKYGSSRCFSEMTAFPRTSFARALLRFLPLSKRRQFQVFLWRHTLATLRVALQYLKPVGRLLR
jgi:hypothetical protein